MSWAVGIAALLVVAVLLAALYRQSRRAADLQLQLDAAAIELQHLQEACSRLAPAGVVQRLVAGGPGAESETAAERKVVTALFADLVDLADERVVERRGGERFGAQPGARERVRLDRGRQDFDGDAALEQQVVRRIDDAHAAGAEHRA